MTGGKARLSVIIPCLNEARFLGRQLSALGSQQLDERWEVVLCDNGSQDESVSIARSFSDRLPYLRVVQASGHRGPSHARNAGSRAASGDLLIFVDADDEVSPGYLRAMVDALGKHRFVAAALDCQTLNQRWVAASRASAQATGLNHWHKLPFAASGTLGMHRAVFEAAGGFDESLLSGEDVDFCWRTQLSGTKLHLADGAFLRYRYSDRLLGIFRQAMHHSLGVVLLSQRYPSYVNVLDHGESARWLAWKLPRLVTRSGRGRWVWRAGFLCGSLKGHLTRTKSAPAMSCDERGA